MIRFGFDDPMLFLEDSAKKKVQVQVPNEDEYGIREEKRLNEDRLIQLLKQTWVG